VKLGYDFSGTVAGVGDKVAKFREGDKVFACLAFHEQVRLFATFIFRNTGAVSTFIIELFSLLSALGIAPTLLHLYNPPQFTLLIHTQGSIAEYALTTESILEHKPKNLTHEEAASIPLVGMTALQGFEKIEGGLEGKTVFVPGGCKCHQFSISPIKGPEPKRIRANAYESK
jgi:NADPH:quinone reductase-like Zn-dependent oxidoreductase